MTVRGSLATSTGRDQLCRGRADLEIVPRVHSRKVSANIRDFRH